MRAITIGLKDVELVKEAFEIQTEVINKVKRIIRKIMIELIIILGVGVVLGMYITSQIKCSIRKSIFNKNIEEYDKNNKTK